MERTAPCGAVVNCLYRCWHNWNDKEKKMPQFVAIDKRVEVIGQTVLTIVEGMAGFKSASMRILEENGIAAPKRTEWYRQQAWLDAFRAISQQVGPNTLFSIGQRIPRMATWPPQVKTIQQALASIDIAYHMNHRIEGKQLFDAVSGRIAEGIGHYRYVETGPQSAAMVCDNPYPCEFDRGIIDAVAHKFKPASSALVTVKHDDAKPCRKKGADSCTYLITWW